MKTALNMSYTAPRETKKISRQEGQEASSTVDLDWWG